jgi:hypothetical protein
MTLTCFVDKFFQAEIQLIITLLTFLLPQQCVIPNSDNILKVAVLPSVLFPYHRQSDCICSLNGFCLNCLSVVSWPSCFSDRTYPTEYHTRSPTVGFISLLRNDYLLLWDYESIQPLASNGRYWLRNASNSWLPRNWLFSYNCLNNSLPRSDVSLRSGFNSHNNNNNYYYYSVIQLVNVQT